MRNYVLAIALLASCGGSGQTLKQVPQCRLVRIDWDNDGDGVVDERELVTYPGAEVERWELVDANGRTITVTTLYFEASGHVLREEEDDDADGRIDVVTGYTYDADGNLVRTEVAQIGSVIPVPVSVTRHTRPDAFTTVAETDMDGDGSPEYTEILTVDADGRLVSKEINYFIAGGLKETWSYAYDADGKLIQTTISGDAETMPVRMSYSYDSFGNPVLQEIDFRSDGTVDVTAEAFYECP